MVIATRPSSPLSSVHSPLDLCAGEPGHSVQLRVQRDVGCDVEPSTRALWARYSRVERTSSRGAMSESTAPETAAAVSSSMGGSAYETLCIPEKRGHRGDRSQPEAEACHPAGVDDGDSRESDLGDGLGPTCAGARLDHALAAPVAEAKTPGATPRCRPAPPGRDGRGGHARARSSWCEASRPQARPGGSGS